MSQVTFLLGGARSGKSRIALELGEKVGGKRAFVATAQPLDAEMERRIREHKASRSATWTTYEEPVELCALLEKLDAQYDVIVVDCLTLWLSNVMELQLEEEGLNARIRSLIHTLEAVDTPVILISNEVGWGVVPAQPSARRFCDAAGFLHQKIAALAREVYWVMAGIPTRIKPLP